MNESIRPLKKGNFRHPDDVEKELGGDIEEDIQEEEQPQYILPSDVDPAVFAGLSLLEKEVVTIIANGELDGRKHTLKGEIGHDERYLVFSCYAAFKDKHPVAEPFVLEDSPMTDFELDRVSEYHDELYKTLEGLRMKGALMMQGVDFQDIMKCYEATVQTEPLIEDKTGPPAMYWEMEFEMTIHPKYVRLPDIDKSNASVSALLGYLYEEVKKKYQAFPGGREHFVLERLEMMQETGIALDYDALRKKYIAAITDKVTDAYSGFISGMIKTPGSIWGASYDQAAQHFSDLSTSLEYLEHWHPYLHKEAIQNMRTDPQFQQAYSEIKKQKSLSTSKHLIDLLEQ